MRDLFQQDDGGWLQDPVLLDRLMVRCTERLSLFAAPATLEQDWDIGPEAFEEVGAVAQAGKKDVLIMSSYENQAMLDALNKGEILGFATQYPVMQGRIAIDTAVRVLEKKDYVKSAKAIPDMVAKSNIDKINMSLVLAPADFKAVYSVKP